MVFIMNWCWLISRIFTDLTDMTLCSFFFFNGFLLWQIALINFLRFNQSCIPGIILFGYWFVFFQMLLDLLSWYFVEYFVWTYENCLLVAVFFCQSCTLMHFHRVSSPVSKGTIIAMTILYFLLLLCIASSLFLSIFFLLKSLPMMAFLLSFLKGDYFLTF